ncbi:unannotated protein [freshwater metagenome]|uniref:Unannotated protein n=1 Tax=freshwater metagenome TaxID=449393 RepID=A0A6J6GKQ2_9ZZZZ
MAWNRPLRWHHCSRGSFPSAVPSCGSCPSRAGMAIRHGQSPREEDERRASRRRRRWSSSAGGRTRPHRRSPRRLPRSRAIRGSARRAGAIGRLSPDRWQGEVSRRFRAPGRVPVHRASAGVDRVGRPKVIRRFEVHRVRRFPHRHRTARRGRRGAAPGTVRTGCRDGVVHPMPRRNVRPERYRRDRMCRPGDADREPG